MRVRWSSPTAEIPTGFRVFVGEGEREEKMAEEQMGLVKLLAKRHVW